MERQKGHLMPLLLDMRSRPVVIFGGGQVGERKARLFSGLAPVRVVSLDFTQGLIGMEGLVELVRADLSQGFGRFLEGAFLAIPATSDSKLNQAIEREACRRGILVNRVEGAGEVVVPSIIRRGQITIAISTEIPGLSRYLRKRIEEEIRGDYQEMAGLLSQIRRELKERVPDQRKRAGVLRRILEDEEVWRLLRISYEKAYMRARSHAWINERDCLDAGDTSQGLDR